MRKLELGHADLPAFRSSHLSVDGLTPHGPNLSHWPGNRSPRRWKADLSTGICLAFAAADPSAQESFLGDVTYVVNNHYDTDGFLSLLVITAPEIVRPRAELCLAAATTGDFALLTTERAFAVDAIVTHLADPLCSPVAAEFEALTGAARDLARYRWLCDHAAEILDHPEAFGPMYEDELAKTREAIEAGRDGAVDRRVFDAVGLTILTGPHDLPRVAVNTLACTWRVLHIETGRDGTRFRYHDRAESWFELATLAPPRRVDLRPLAARLQALEASEDRGIWQADPPDYPVPELYFGAPAAAKLGGQPRLCAASRLDSAQVIATLVQHLRDGALESAKVRQ